jgi:hypothetical protein
MKRLHLNLKLRSSPLKTNFSCTNAWSNLCGRTVFNYGAVRSRPIHIIQRLQPKIPRSITNAPWYVPNLTLQNDLHIPFVVTEIGWLSHLYHYRLASHHNALVTALATLPPIVIRLKRWWPTDLFHVTMND